MTSHSASGRKNSRSRWQREFSNVKNWLYFDSLTDPNDISLSKYFEFCSPLSTDRSSLHRRWVNVVLPIVENSQYKNLNQQKKRLQREWDDGVAVEAFWAKIEDKELKEAQKRNERKHRISLEENAVDQLGSAFGYFSKKTKKTYETELSDPRNPFGSGGSGSTTEEKDKNMELAASTIHTDEDLDENEFNHNAPSLAKRRKQSGFPMYKSASPTSASHETPFESRSDGQARIPSGIHAEQDEDHEDEVDVGDQDYSEQYEDHQVELGARDNEEDMHIVMAAQARSLSSSSAATLSAPFHSPMITSSSSINQKRAEYVLTSSRPSIGRACCIGSPPPLPTNLIAPRGLSKLPLPTFTVEGLQYAVLNQRTEWKSIGVNIGVVFMNFKQQRRASLEIAHDDIIDITTDSSFLDYASDTEFNAVVADFPKSEPEPQELEELTLLFGATCTYEELRDRVFNTPPNTPIRRFLFRIIDSYSRYFPKHKDVPSLFERQAMFDLLCPFIRSALLVYDIESDMSEIPIVGSGLRKNSGKDASEKLSKCRLADITANDRVGIQVFLAECSQIYEKGQRKFKEDRWKLARAMKDSWDLAVRKHAENQKQPHEGLSVYGLHFFDEQLVFLKLDYCGHYRLWQLDSAELPLHYHDFFEKTDACSKAALNFASVIAKEVNQRKRLTVVPPAGVLALSRASRSLKRTTDS